MEPFCIRFVGDYLPVIKSMIAKKMMDDYKMSQNKIADVLEMTQPAISQYKRSLRGNKFEILDNNQKVLDILEEITKQLAIGELSQEEKNTVYCRICKAISGK